MMNEQKKEQIPDQLLEAVNGGISVTPFEGEALNILEQQKKCPYCGQLLKLENSRSQYAGSGITLNYYVCYSCVKVYEQTVYSYGGLSSEWGEVNA